MNAGSSQIRILTVDDHPVVRQGIAGLLAIQTDITLVGEASNGREAIQQFRAHRPDITLMDLQMPEMNGIDALIAIRSEFPAANLLTSDSWLLTSCHYHPRVCNNSLGSIFCTSRPFMASPTSAEHSATTCGSL